MKKISTAAIFCTLLLSTTTLSDGYNSALVLFKNKTVTNNNGFRIPAITTTAQGTVIAVTDIRYAGTSGNTDMPRKVELMVKVSNDGGATWGEGEILTSPTTINGKNYITDACIVSNKDTGTTFLFGYQNDKAINTAGGEFDWIVYSSNDGGKSWDSGSSIKEILPKGFEYALQGPGNGMYYNGTLYVPYQAWNNKGGEAPKATSGFIYSKDNGKTWESSELLSNVTSLLTSESSVFHHKGKIYLAAKNESKDTTTTEGEKARIVYSTSDNGKTWEKVEEDFLPDNIAKAETSTLSLSEDVYLVGYALQGNKPWDRNDIYLTTNTGKSIKLWEGDSYGYTSTAMDDDNLYALYEGSSTTGDVMMRRFDIAAKEYANVNAQIVRRGHDLLKDQEKLFATHSYLNGAYGTDDENKVEGILQHNNYKLGVFHKKEKKNNEDVYRTIEYTSEDTILVLSQNDVIKNNDNIFIGYEYSKIKYINGSKNDVNSFVAGYSQKYKFQDGLTYDLGINGIYSNNKLKRNDKEGLGKAADFDSYSFGLRNKLSKNISVNKVDLKFLGGLDTQYFGHEKIKEKNGNDFNDATVSKSNNFSNEVFINAIALKDITIKNGVKTTFGLNLEYRNELMDVDKWSDKFTVLDVEKEYATPVEDNRGGVASAEIFTNLELSNKVEIGISYKRDSLGKDKTMGRLTYKF
ncbi:exo-alpha-sialidase [Cetobacterium somerae]